MTVPSTELTFKSILDAALDAVVVIDHRGRIEEFNRAAEALFGYTKSEIVGTNVSQLMPGPHMERHDGYVERYLTHGQGSAVGIGREVDACRKDGRVFPTWISLSVLPNSDPPRFIGFIRDMSSQKELESQKELSARSEAERAHHTEMNNIAADLAHEINQPLTAISNYALACERLLSSAELELTEVKNALRQISHQALRAGETIQKLRDVVQSRTPPAAAGVAIFPTGR
jgi:two-component system, LuxR family, sensor kinase FixL